MNNIHSLLDNLNAMIPLSAGFRNDLQPMMTEKNKRLNYVFFKRGQIAKKAWQLISGFIVVLRKGAADEEVLERIYFANDIVTDLDSFFETHPIRFRYVAATEVTVLEINRSDVMKLQKYPETAKLIQHITLIDKKATEDLVQMLRLPEQDRVRFFLENYPITGLPACYCASLLNVPLDKYSAYADTIEFSSLANKDLETDNRNQIAYKIRNHITDNYASIDIGNSQHIAELFNMTSVTLNRLYRKNFGTTIHKFVVRCRMLKARNLLKNSELSIGKIALAVGYKNIFHFSKVFKNYYGYPPRKDKTK